MSPSAPDSVPPADGEPPQGRLRGLWDVMRQEAAPPETTPAADPAAEESPSSATSEPPPETFSPEVARPAARSLWAVMGTGWPPASHPGETEADDADSEESLLNLEVGEPIFDDLDEAGSDATPDESNVEPQVAEDSSPTSPPSLVTLRKPTSNAHHDWWALALGMIAVPLSGLAFLPGVVPSSPSAACGLIAVGLTMLVWTQPRVGGLSRIRSAAGGLAALIALMAGPLIFAPWGNAYRDRQSVRATQLHLEEIGRGLQRHHEELGAYPIGGTRMTDAQGRRRGGHGWMTHLLPYINQATLYNRIHLELPYDDPANRPALGTPIETYFSADGDRRLIAGVFATSHFAGVGGTVVTTRGEELGAGIFDLGRAYRESDLVDGLANTWIVGEIPGGYPPWGDPENWRSIKKGINRDPDGFGNVAGTGSTCLFADGSVRFLSNKTDVDLLRRLSTRNARDLTD